MKRKLPNVTIVIAVLFSVFFTTALHSQDLPVLRAMEDELQRTMKNLKLGKEKPPYYVAYRVDDEEKITISGRFGAIVEDGLNRERKLYVDLRVGDYDFDNANFVPMSDYGFSFGAGDNAVQLPLDDDYDAIRQKIWLATDERYKEAIDVLFRKKSFLAHKEITEKIPDFSQSTSYVMIAEPQKLKVDRVSWLKNIREISSLFRQYPKIQTSKVFFSVRRLTRYFIDSEGNKQITNSSIVRIEAWASTRTKTGAEVKNAVNILAPTPEDLPPISAIMNRIKAMAETLSYYTEAKEEKDYTGPVLFDGSAAGQLFYQLFGKGVSDTRKPLYEQEGMSEMVEDKTGFLADRLEKLVLPKEFSVEDDPTLTKFNNIPLIGGYLIDDEGVRAERIELVKAGRLVSLPVSRRPTKEIKKSNGHGRYFNGTVRSYISNLIVQSEKTTLDLEKELIALCKDNDLEYGIVITQLATSLPKTTEEMVEEIYSYFGGSKTEIPLLNAPLIAYKLYTDGRKELIRGLKFEGVTPAVLKDIVAVGRIMNVHNAIIQERFGSGYLPISVVAPSVIVQKMTLTGKEEKAKKPPFLPHPYFGKIDFIGAVLPNR
ncbi:MAG: metallopeptidase TldD-related protein [candidate division WOR-3 bacterium]